MHLFYENHFSVENVCALLKANSFKGSKEDLHQRISVAEVLIASIPFPAITDEQSALWYKATYPGLHVPLPSRT